MDLESRRELYNGFGDAMARGIEYVGTPALFALIGFFLDKRLGLTPVLTIALTLFALAGTAVRAYYGYSAAMSEHEARGPWARPRPVGGPEYQAPESQTPMVQTSQDKASGTW